MTTFDFDAITTAAAALREGKESVRLNGTFNVEVAYAQGSTRKKDGSAKNPSVALKFLVLDGPQIGAEAWYNVTLTEKSKAVFGKSLLDLGVPADFLRSLGSADSEDALLAAFEEIAEGLVGARYNITVGPQAKRPDFDNYVINTVVDEPQYGAPSGAQAQAPVNAASAPLPPAQAPPTQIPAPLPAQPLVASAGVPGGFVPQLHAN